MDVGVDVGVCTWFVHLLCVAALVCLHVCVCMCACLRFGLFLISTGMGRLHAAFYSHASFTIIIVK